MFYIHAPYPTMQTLTVLPNPQFSDSMALTDAVIVKRAMDGTRYTYVKTKNDRRKMKWKFHLTRNKGLELRAFIRSYFASTLKVVDHLGRTWIGHFCNSPFEFDTPERAAPARTPLVRGELQAIEIDFEGVEQ